jgi:hypothetical protein
LFALAGCNDARLSKLEQDNASLTKQLDALRNSISLRELESKCGQDARAFFDKRWPGAGTPAKEFNQNSDFTNHFSAKRNRCFAAVQEIFISAGGVTQIANVWDVYENRKLGDIGQIERKGSTQVIRCEVSGRSCDSMDEYKSLIAEFMTN